MQCVCACVCVCVCVCVCDEQCVRDPSASKLSTITSTHWCRLMLRELLAQPNVCRALRRVSELPRHHSAIIRRCSGRKRQLPCACSLGLMSRSRHS
jgi:hypothetical protein